MDVFDKTTRSQIMQSVKSTANSSTEKKLVQYFKSHGIIGWRRHYAVIGKPDFAFLERKVAVFVDGCFWHGHNCRNVKPKQNKEYWEKKLRRNKERDLTINARLSARGWKVIRIWECEMADGKLDNLFNVLA
jgi:DNA mismatch endonuclease (patch repair protein)